jgi:hypothetical protein
MAVLTVQTITLSAAGTAVTWNSAGASGDTFTNNGRVLVVAKNLSTSSCAVTLVTPQKMTGASLAVGDLTVPVAASTTIAIGPLPTGTFNAASSVVSMTYANDSTLTLALLKY